MNRTLIAQRVREQLEQFSGIVSPRFSKPQGRFLTQMIYGLHAHQDVKLSSIARALGEEIELKKTEERLSHHLAVPGMAQILNEQIATHAAPRVKADTLIVVDPTDVRKTYARHMPFLATVRDGSTGEFVPGYWACIAVACEAGKRRVTPLQMRLWSAEAPDFESENLQLLQLIDTIRSATKNRGVYVIDRGGDRMKLFSPLLERGLRFIVRLVGSRHLRCGGEETSAAEVAQACPMSFTESVVKEEAEGEKRLVLQYGYRPVKLPGHEDQLYLVVVRGFGEEPLMLLTNVALSGARKGLWYVVQGYLARWLVEETIRFIKQSYHLEDLRVLSYERLKNLVAVVLVAVYFSAVWLGESLKLAVLTTRITQAARRFFGVPDFHYYALADGLAVLLSRLGRFTPRPSNPSPLGSRQLALSFADA